MGITQPSVTLRHSVSGSSPSDSHSALRPSVSHSALRPSVSEWWIGPFSILVHSSIESVQSEMTSLLLLKDGSTIKGPFPDVGSYTEKEYKRRFAIKPFKENLWLSSKTSFEDIERLRITLFTTFESSSYNDITFTKCEKRLSGEKPIVKKIRRDSPKDSPPDLRSSVSHSALRPSVSEWWTGPYKILVPNQTEWVQDAWKDYDVDKTFYKKVIREIGGKYDEEEYKRLFAIELIIPRKGTVWVHKSANTQQIVSLFEKDD